MQRLIDQLWDFNDAAGSEQRFRQAAEQCTDQAQRLELLTQVARALGLQRKFEEAHRTLDEVTDAIPRQAYGLPAAPPFATAHGRSLLERGRLLNSAGHAGSAMPLFEQAFNAGKAIHDDHLAVDAAHMIAIAHGAIGSHADALRWNLQALQLADSSTQPRAKKWRASLHNNIGWTLHERSEFTQALKHFESALACRREDGDSHLERVARWCVGRCLRSLQRVDEALMIQQALLQEGEQIGVQADGFVHEELAECLLMLGRAREASRHGAEAHRLLSQDQHFVAAHPTRLQRLMSLAAPEAPAG